MGLWWHNVHLPIYLLLVLFALGTGGYAVLARRFALRNAALADGQRKLLAAAEIVSISYCRQRMLVRIPCVCAFAR